MDFDQLKAHLDQCSDEQLEAAADELHAFVAHRKQKPKKGTQAAPFNAGNFFKNLIKVVQAILPVIGPLIGLDQKPGQQPTSQ